MRKKISSDQIAELAQVSQSTVSRAFDPDSNVSAKTRKKF
ncbi:LacI family DNA-binding transcriptional regulator [Mammaliicoccus lentus]